MQAEAKLLIDNLVSHLIILFLKLIYDYLAFIAMSVDQKK